MNLITGIFVYIIIWWVALFIVLPLGVQSQWEEGDAATPVEGSEPGAPTNPNLLRKAVMTSILAAIIWIVVALTIEFSGISFRPDGPLI